MRDHLIRMDAVPADDETLDRFEPPRHLDTRRSSIKIYPPSSLWPVDVVPGRRVISIGAGPRAGALRARMSSSLLVC